MIKQQISYDLSYECYLNIELPNLSSDHVSLSSVGKEVVSMVLETNVINELKLAKYEDEILIAGKHNNFICRLHLNWRKFWQPTTKNINLLTIGTMVILQSKNCNTLYFGKLLLLTFGMHTRKVQNIAEHLNNVKRINKF